MNNKDVIQEAVKEFTSKHSSFPWRWYGDVPKSGTVHSYLCTILSRFANSHYRPFLKGSPTFRELKRLKDDMDPEDIDFLIIEIVRYCDSVYSVGTRGGIEAEVFDFLVKCKPLRDDLEKKTRFYLFGE